MLALIVRNYSNRHARRALIYDCHAGCRAASMWQHGWLTAGNLWGGILVVSASVVSNVSANIQKRSHNMEELRPVAERRGYARRKLWWIGMLGVICGGVMDFVALGFASQTLVAALGGAASMLTNGTVSYFWNREPAGPTDLAGATAVVSGAAVFACTARASRAYSLAQLERLFVEPVFVVCTMLQCTLTLMMLTAVRGSRVHRLACRVLHLRLHRRRWRRRHVWWWWQWWGERPNLPSLPYELTTNDGGHEEGEEEEEEEEDDEEEIDATVAGSDQYVYATCSGSVGALSVLLGGCASKVILELWARRGDGSDLARPVPVLFVVGMLVCVVMQTHLLNRAMMAGDNMSVIPVFNAAWTLFGVQGGTVFYQHGSVDIAGVALMAIGTVLLMQHQRAPSASPPEGGGDDNDDRRQSCSPKCTRML